MVVDNTVQSYKEWRSTESVVLGNGELNKQNHAILRKINCLSQSKLSPDVCRQTEDGRETLILFSRKQNKQMKTFEFATQLAWSQIFHDSVLLCAKRKCTSDMYRLWNDAEHFHMG